MFTPAKAQDLKHQIAWGAPDPLVQIKNYLTPDWVLEPKLDGVRMLVQLGTTANRMNSGRTSDVSGGYVERAENFPHLRDAVQSGWAGTLLDGELMPATKGDTLASVMSLVNSAPSVATAIQKRQGNAVFMAFDVLAIHGQPTAALPLSERRVLLSAIIGHLHAVDPSFQIITQMPATTDNIALCLDEGFEGVMLKRKSGRYVPGKRMADWQKVKRYSTGDFFIIGSVPGNGRNDGKVGSMKVAYLDDAGHEVYCADVAGIDDAFRNELTDPETGRLSTSFVGKVIEVMAQGKTKNGRLRHPHFVRLRPDKSSEDCTSECSIALFEDV